MKRPKATYKLWKTGGKATCSYCAAKTNGYLTFKDRSECWACPPCALKYGELKRLRNLLEKYPQKKRSSKFSENSLVNFAENSIVAEGSNVST